MFAITDHKGFQMKFSNGWTASVQFGPGNYCEHHASFDLDAPKKAYFFKSELAEIAAWPDDTTKRPDQNDWYQFGSDVVKGYCSANEVLDFLNVISTIGETPWPR